MCEIHFVAQVSVKTGQLRGARDTHTHTCSRLILSILVLIRLFESELVVWVGVREVEHNRELQGEKEREREIHHLPINR